MEGQPNMRTKFVRAAFLATIALAAIARGQTVGNPDPNGILRKPIPDKVVVLTFDDGPLSNPHFPALRSDQRLFQEPPAKSNFLAIIRCLLTPPDVLISWL